MVRWQGGPECNATLQPPGSPASIRSAAPVPARLQVLGGFFGQQRGQAVSQLLELCYLVRVEGSAEWQRGWAGALLPWGAACPSRCLLFRSFHRLPQDQRLLVSIHESGTMRLWDLPSRRWGQAVELASSRMPARPPACLPRQRPGLPASRGGGDNV